mmetsp:Transcript_11889/g.21978  ORF Transcript_11889/g.21978 Transcript_11889/m.21978 type:complete len:397 (-) Transcript_11889:471-1661(-)
MMQSDDSSSAPYRPRYSADESSDVAFENDQRHRRCMGRKRRAAIIILLVAFIIVVGGFTRVYLFFVGVRGGDRLTYDRQTSFKRIETSSLLGRWKNKILDKAINGAKADSNGFFEISDDEWLEMKHETKTMIDLQDGIGGRTSYLLSESGANINSNVWWIDNWKINFTCQNKVSIGGKWLCDPSRIITMADEKAKSNRPRGRKKRHNQQKECIVYISGGWVMEFSQQFLDYSLARIFELHSGQVGEDPLACEVHIFTPDGQQVPDARDGLFVHHWGFRPSNKESMGLAADNTTTIAFKTLDETIAELKHSGRISILALDCESCEWDIYSDILALDEPIQQVLLQMHGTPYMANELFLAMQEAGYVIFHREAEFSGSGEVYDYSWLKLSPSFFNWKV